MHCIWLWHHFINSIKTPAISRPLKSEMLNSDFVETRSCGRSSVTANQRYSDVSAAPLIRPSNGLIDGTKWPGHPPWQSLPGCHRPGTLPILEQCTESQSSRLQLPGSMAKPCGLSNSVTTVATPVPSRFARWIKFLRPDLPELDQ